MNEISAQNRTIFFVSHHINSVLSLCNKGILLENGALKAFEPIQECISRYILSCPVAGLSWKGIWENAHIRLNQAVVTPPLSNKNYFSPEETTCLEIDFEILQPHPSLILGFSILNSHNQIIAHSKLSDHPTYHSLLDVKGRHRVSFPIHLNLFHPGEYQIRIDCSLGRKQKLLQGEILLKFALFSENQLLKSQSTFEETGISLGNQWLNTPCYSNLDLLAASKFEDRF